MNKIRVVGIDIAKSVFQVCVWMVDGTVAWNVAHLRCEHGSVAASTVFKL